MSDKAWQCLKNITIKILKLHLMALVAACYLALALWIAMKARSYIYRDKPTILFDSYGIIRGMIYIPEEIAKTKDCEQLFQWQWDHLPPVLHGKCPWYKYTDHYEVKIGAVELNIPRKYLFLQKETDRESDIITFNSFIYPSMNLVGMRYSRDGISCTLESRKTNEPFKTRLEQYFWSFLSMDPSKADYKIELISFDQDIEKYKYKITQFFKQKNGSVKGYDEYFYTNDSIEEIEEFIVCNGDDDDATCQSAFAYSDVYIKYMFKHHLVTYDDDIKNKIIELVNQWRIKK